MKAKQPRAPKQGLGARTRPAAPRGRGAKRGRRPNEQRKIDIASEAIEYSIPEQLAIHDRRAKAKYSRWTMRQKTRLGGSLYATASQFNVTVRTVQKYLKEYRQQAIDRVVAGLNSKIAALELLEKKAAERKLAAIDEAFSKTEASGLTGDAQLAYLNQLLAKTREVK